MKVITSIPQIVGQTIYALDPFYFIQIDKIDSKIFTFDLSNFSSAINSATGTLLASFVYDYTQTNPTSTFLNAYLPYTNSAFNYVLDISRFYIFGSTDKDSFTVIDPSNYSGSLDSSLSTLTIEFSTNILDTFSYITIGYLDSVDPTNYILSKNILELV